MTDTPIDTPTEVPGERRRGDLRRRSLRHYLPLALAGGVAVVVLTNIAFFDVNRNSPPMDLFTEGLSGAFPSGDGASMQMTHDSGTAPGPAAPNHQPATDDPTGSPSMDHESGNASGMDHDAEAGGTGMQDHAGDPETVRLMRRLSTATGYIALALIAATLLVGPVNLMRGRRTPVSTYLRRDIGILAAVTSALHVGFGLLVKHGDGTILSYFLAPTDRTRILTNSFGLANWVGLAALLIALGLAAISSDAALRRLRARRWKRLQRLNYLLFALVVVHSLLYGALWRETSPYTITLGLLVVAVVAGQALGVRLWRRRDVVATTA
jgi:sulfoxide reductase heme-binding subunit YedZ